MNKKSKNKERLTVEPTFSDDEGLGKETVDPYRVTWFDRIPFWIKSCFIKYWVCGAVYFFVDFGLGNLIWGEDNATGYSAVILILAGGVIYGLADLILGNFLLRMCEQWQDQAKPYTIVYSSKIWAMLLMIVYGVLFSYVTHMISAGLITLLPKGTWLFREPLSFALIGLLIEAVCVGLKDLAVYLYKKIRHKESI